MRLEYTRGAGTQACREFEADAFRTYVTMHLRGLDPFDPADAQKLRTGTLWRTVRVHIERGGPGFKGTIRAFDEKGDQVWEDSISVLRCSDVVQGLALIFAIGFEPAYPPPPPAAPPPPPSAPLPSAACLPPAPASPPPPSPPATSALPPPPARPPNEVPSRPPFRLGVGPFLAVGRIPKYPSPGILVSADLWGPVFSMAIDVRVLLPVVPVDVRLDTGQSATLRFSMMTGSVGPCLHINPLFFCAPLELGARDFSATPNAIASVDETFLASIAPRAGVDVPIARRFFFRGYADAAIMFKPYRLLVEGREVWRAPPFSGIVSAAFGMKL